MSTIIKSSLCQSSPNQNESSRTFCVLLHWSKATLLRATIAVVNLTAVGIAINRPTTGDTQKLNRAHCAALDSGDFVLSLQKLSPILINYPNPEHNMREIKEKMSVALSNALSLQSFMAKVDIIEAQLNVGDPIDRLRIRKIAQRCYIQLIKAYNFKLGRILGN